MAGSQLDRAWGPWERVYLGSHRSARQGQVSRSGSGISGGQVGALSLGRDAVFLCVSIVSIVSGWLAG